MHKIRKKCEAVSEVFKDEPQTNHEQERLLRTPLAKLGVQSNTFLTLKWQAYEQEPLLKISNFQ